MLAERCIHLRFIDAALRRCLDPSGVYWNLMSHIHGTSFGSRGWLPGLILEDKMKRTIIALSAACLMASSTALFAQGVSSKSPGHEMQDRGSKKGSPGASGYAPGQEMQAKGSKSGSAGASGYAPGQTTGSSTGMKSGGSSRSK
ncbi:hypothetical protein XI02_30685 [Bradyrhizobium sp. CCBAU 21365]|jgi:hypothetical protein|nr:hypothetical protein XI02_30685 [Bradyrhizobium sp. CCBAU 21365]